MRWSDLTWSEIPDVLARCGQVAILPVGATEQHGPHLGCGVDFVIAEQLCAAVAAQTGVPMLPTLPYGCSLGHSRRWPGTIALQPVTLIQLVKEIGDWAYHSGIRRLFIVNAHVTNAAPLRCALEMLRAEHDDLMVAVINTATLSERLDHAGHRARGRAPRQAARGRRPRSHLRLRLRPSGQPHQPERRHRHAQSGHRGERPALVRLAGGRSRRAGPQGQRRNAAARPILFRGRRPRHHPIDKDAS
jgi:hypothetical protein